MLNFRSKFTIAIDNIIVEQRPFVQVIDVWNTYSYLNFVTCSAGLSRICFRKPWNYRFRTRYQMRKIRISLIDISIRFSMMTKVATLLNRRICHPWDLRMQLDTRSIIHVLLMRKILRTFCHAIHYMRFLKISKIRARSSGKFVVNSFLMEEVRLINV